MPQAKRSKVKRRTETHSLEIHYLSGEIHHADITFYSEGERAVFRVYDPRDLSSSRTGELTGSVVDLLRRGSSQKARR